MEKTMADEVELTREEKAEIFSSLKSLAIGMAEVRMDIAHIKNNLPKQPCQWQVTLEKRVQVIEEESRKTTQDWRKAAIDFASKIVWVVLVAAFAYARGKGLI
jgi:hypothetical protein